MNHLDLELQFMNGYFQIVGEEQSHKHSIWPVGNFREDQILFVGDTSPFKLWGRLYRWVSATFQKYPQAQRDPVLSLMGLDKEPRVTT